MPALAHLRALLTTLPPEGVTLAQLVPIPAQGGASPVQRRTAAVASTLLAGLELACGGALGLEQEVEFGEIRTQSLNRCLS